MAGFLRNGRTFFCICRALWEEIRGIIEVQGTISHPSLAPRRPKMAKPPHNSISDRRDRVDSLGKFKKH